MIDPEPSPDYAVGYGRPPVETRWKKGQSGNPKGGRRRARPRLLGSLEKAMWKKVETPPGQDGAPRRVRLAELVVDSLAEAVRQGELKAMCELMRSLRVIGRLEAKRAAEEEAKDTGFKFVSGPVDLNDDATFYALWDAFRADVAREAADAMEAAAGSADADDEETPDEEVAESETEAGAPPAAAAPFADDVTPTDSPDQPVPAAAPRAWPQPPDPPPEPEEDWVERMARLEARRGVRHGGSGW